MQTPKNEADYSTLSKSEKYSHALLLLKGVTEGEGDLIANLSNAAAILNEIFHWWWTGFYLVKEDELVLGPFQGPVACTRIARGRGVCGTAWETEKTLIVPDVDAFPGHIACSALSKSEIVVPLIREGKVWGVLDADSEHLNHFDTEDAAGLAQIATLLSSLK